jgi:hypothetical protein
MDRWGNGGEHGLECLAISLPRASNELAEIRSSGL